MSLRWDAVNFWSDTFNLLLLLLHARWLWPAVIFCR